MHTGPHATAQNPACEGEPCPPQTLGQGRWAVPSRVSRRRQQRVPWIPAKGQILGASSLLFLLALVTCTGNLIPWEISRGGSPPRTWRRDSTGRLPPASPCKVRPLGRSSGAAAPRRVASTDFTHGRHALQSPHVPSQVRSCFCSQGPLGVRKSMRSTGRFISMPNLLINKPGKSKKCH